MMGAIHIAVLVLKRSQIGWRLLALLTLSLIISVEGVFAQSKSYAGSEVGVELCGRNVPGLAIEPDTVLIWLPSGVRSLPDLRLLRQGDGLVTKARTAKEAEDGIVALKQRIASLGGNPADYKYIVRTFPQDLAPEQISGSKKGAPFFANASPSELRKLRESVFAIMFDHERAWYDRNPDILPLWTWDYDWTLRQVRLLSDTISDQCIPAGVLVTPSSRVEGKWTGPNSELVRNGFARLLDTRVTGVRYLVVQTQPRCRSDNSGSEFGSFARKLVQEMDSIFPADNEKRKNLIMQVSIDDVVHQEKTRSRVPKANYVPPDWSTKCLVAAAGGGRETQMAAVRNKINGFFLWSGSRRATCETLKNFRGPVTVECGSGDRSVTHEEEK